MPKSNAERCRDYRRRAKLTKIKKIPSTSTERVRKYRARIKALLNAKNDISNTLHDFTGQNNENDHHDTQVDILSVQALMHHASITHNVVNNDCVSTISPKIRDEQLLIEQELELNELLLNSKVDVKYPQSPTQDQFDRIASPLNFLVLTETWRDEVNIINIANFNTVVKYKKPCRRYGDVTIYHNKNGRGNIFTPQIILNSRRMESSSIQVSEVGEICTCQTTSDNSNPILIVAIYIFPNHSINTIIEFIYENLMAYTPEVSRILGGNYHKLPMILSGNFNNNFASETAIPLIEFLTTKFNLKMCRSSAALTTKPESVIDAVFQRYIY